MARHRRSGLHNIAYERETGYLRDVLLLEPGERVAGIALGSPRWSFADP